MASTSEDLDKLAREMLLHDAKRGAERAKTMGPEGWLKPRLLSTNKQFLKRTIQGVVHSQKIAAMPKKTQESPQSHRPAQRVEYPQPSKKIKVELADKAMKNGRLNKTEKYRKLDECNKIAHRRETKQKHK